MRTATSSHPDAFAARPGTILHLDDAVVENIVDLHGYQGDAGTTRRLMDQGLIGDETCPFAVGVYRLEPHERHPLHLHLHAAEFYFVLSGRARFTLGDDVVEGTPGLSLYMPIGMPHAVETDDEPVEVLYGFTPSDIQALGTTWLAE